MFLFQVLYPISLFILARILFPMSTEPTSTDMKAYYLANYRKLFILVLILSILSALENVIVHDLGAEGWYTNAGILLVLLVLVIRKQVPEKTHKALAVLLLATMILGIAVNINEWSITN